MRHLRIVASVAILVVAATCSWAGVIPSQGSADLADSSYQVPSPAAPATTTSPAAPVPPAAPVTVKQTATAKAVVVMLEHKVGSNWSRRTASKPTVRRPVVRKKLDSNDCIYYKRSVKARAMQWSAISTAQASADAAWAEALAARNLAWIAIALAVVAIILAIVALVRRARAWGYYG